MNGTYKRILLLGLALCMMGIGTVFGAGNTVDNDISKNMAKEQANMSETNKNLLNKKEVQLVKISQYTATGDQASLKESLMKSLDEGLTVNEAKDAMVQLYALLVFHVV